MALRYNLTQRRRPLIPSPIVRPRSQQMSSNSLLFHMAKELGRIGWKERNYLAQQSSTIYSFGRPFELDTDMMAWRDRAVRRDRKALRAPKIAVDVAFVGGKGDLMMTWRSDDGSRGGGTLLEIRGVSGLLHTPVPNTSR